MSDRTIDERTIDADQIREEHLTEAHEAVQWAYLFGVLLFGTIGMLVMIAILDVI